MAVVGFPAGMSLSPLLRELAFTTVDDVLSVFPQYMQESDSVVRDAIMEGLLYGFASYCSDMAANAGETSPAYASGFSLDLLGDKIIERFAGEDDGHYRARQLHNEKIIAPALLLEAIDDILAPLGLDGLAYYQELGEDEIYFFAHSDTDTNGYYFPTNGPTTPPDYPIEIDTRRYDARTRCKPLHGFWFGTFNNPTYSRKNGYGNDYSDAFNEWGHVLIGIPSFTAPGSSDPADHTLITTEFLSTFSTTSGVLTDYAQYVADDAGEYFTEAACEADDALGSNYFSIESEGAIIISTIQSLLERYSDFPKRFTIVLDPEIVVP